MSDPLANQGPPPGAAPPAAPEINPSLTLQAGSLAANTAASALMEAMQCQGVGVPNSGAIRCAVDSWLRAAATLRPLLPADQQESRS